MTNRPKSAPKSRLRFLDLSFDSKDSSHYEQPLNNGIRPHGGYRGTKRRPPGTYSFDKGLEYHGQLREDIERLLADEVLEIQGTPAWALEVNKEQTHSGESPLFVNKVLSPSKYENEYGHIKLKRACSSARTVPPSRDGTTYYRPNKTHQYLTATELRENNSDPNVKYGKPTRASLLRDRQRSGNSPVNAYDLRRELMKRLSEIKNSAIVVNPKQFVQLYSLNDDTESLHSFLIGARYNSAHCLDSKSMAQHGVYMPRNNPLGCFVVRQNKSIEQRNGTITPPDYDETSSPVHAPPRSLSAIGTAVSTYSPVPSIRPRSAWTGSSHRKLSTHMSDNEGDNANNKGNKTSSSTYVLTGPKLPLVKGVSVNKKVKQLRETIEAAPSTEQPPPTPVGFVSAPTENETLLREQSFDSKNSKRKTEMVDRCFNVPSIASGDVGNVREFADLPYIEDDETGLAEEIQFLNGSEKRKVTFVENTQPEKPSSNSNQNDGLEGQSGETNFAGNDVVENDVTIDDISNENDIGCIEPNEDGNPNITVFITEGKNTDVIHSDKDPTDLQELDS